MYFLGTAPKCMLVFPSERKEPRDMTTLSDALKKANTNQYSARRISELATAQGYKVDNSTVAKYLRGEHPNPPKRKTLQALAAALGVDIAVFEKAAALAPSLTPFELPAEAAALDEDERRAVLNLVKVMVRNKQPQTPTPSPAADFHPERAGYDLAAHHDDEARARLDWLDSLGEEPQ